MAENIIIGRKMGFKFWSKLHEISGRKMRRRQEIELRLIGTSFPTANSCIVKFERVDTREKYEHIMQGRYGEHYRKQVADPTYIPEDIQIDNVIKESYLKERAYLLNQ